MKTSAFVNLGITGLPCKDDKPDKIAFDALLQNITHYTDPVQQLLGNYLYIIKMCEMHYHKPMYITNAIIICDWIKDAIIDGSCSSKILSDFMNDPLEKIGTYRYSYITPYSIIVSRMLFSCLQQLIALPDKSTDQLKIIEIITLFLFACVHTFPADFHDKLSYLFSVILKYSTPTTSFALIKLMFYNFSSEIFNFMIYNYSSDCVKTYKIDIDNIHVTFQLIQIIPSEYSSCYKSLANLHLYYNVPIAQLIYIPKTEDRGQFPCIPLHLLDPSNTISIQSLHTLLAPELASGVAFGAVFGAVADSTPSIAFDSASDIAAPAPGTAPDSTLGAMITSTPHIAIVTSGATSGSIPIVMSSGEIFNIPISS
jgi:hypothetical protein